MTYTNQFWWGWDMITPPTHTHTHTHTHTRFFLVRMISSFLCFSSLLSLGRMPSCIKTDRERQQHMSVAEDAALTGRAYRLCSSSLQTWLPLTAPTADKSGNIKENRIGAQSTYQCFFSSNPTTLLPATTSSSSFYSLSSQSPTPGCQSCREGEVTSQGFASSLEAHHVSGSLSCVRLPPGKLWSSPRLGTSRLLAKEGREGGREKN